MKICDPNKNTNICEARKFESWNTEAKSQENVEKEEHIKSYFCKVTIFQQCDILSKNRQTNQWKWMEGTKAEQYIWYLMYDKDGI